MVYLFLFLYFPPGPLLYRQSFRLLHIYSHDSCNSTRSRQVNILRNETSADSHQTETFTPPVFCCFDLHLSREDGPVTPAVLQQSADSCSHTWMSLQVRAARFDCLLLSASEPHRRDLLLCNCIVGSVHFRRGGQYLDSGTYFRFLEEGWHVIYFYGCVPYSKL